MSAYVGISKNLKDLIRGGYRDGRHEVQEGRKELTQGAQGPHIHHLRGCGGSQPAQSRPPALFDPVIRLAMVWSPLTLFCVPDRDARGISPSQKNRFCGEITWTEHVAVVRRESDRRAESAQLGDKNESEPSCVLTGPVHRGARGPSVVSPGSHVAQGTTSVFGGATRTWTFLTH